MPIGEQIGPVNGGQSSGGGGSGTVTSFAFTTGNGFTGNVTNSTTTPALTLNPFRYPVQTITADPNPAAQGQYYRANYAGNGNFTLPSSSLNTGEWILVKNITNFTLAIVGTVDGSTSYQISSLNVSVLFIYNGATWDAN